MPISRLMYNNYPYTFTMKIINVQCVYYHIDRWVNIFTRSCHKIYMQYKL